MFEIFVYISLAVIIAVLVNMLKEQMNHNELMKKFIGVYLENSVPEQKIIVMDNKDES